MRVLSTRHSGEPLMNSPRPGEPITESAITVLKGELMTATARSALPMPIAMLNHSDSRLEVCRGPRPAVRHATVEPRGLGVNQVAGVLRTAPRPEVVD